MTLHLSHNMRETSLLQYIQTYSESQFNQAFRQETKRQIIELLQQHHDMTDREIAFRLGYADPNKVRPRRNELVKHDIVEEDCKRECSIGHKLSISWRLNQGKLFAYIQSKI